MTVTKTNGTAIDAPTTIINNTENEKKNIVTETEELTNEEDEITLEDLAPEGGWGWMIALGMILTYFTIMGPGSSFGMIFADFLEASGQAGFATSLFNSSFMVTFSTAAILTNTLLKRFSARQVGVVGALLFGIPDILLAFVSNIYEMAAIFFFQGFGFGLFMTVCNTVFNAYFVKKRAKVMSASQVIIGLGNITFPIMVAKMIEWYGFRGTAAILGALSLNGVVGMSLMHPVEWHARKPEEVRAERAREKQRRISIIRKNSEEIALSKRRSTIDVIHVISKWSSLRSLKEEKEMPLLTETLKTSAQRVASISAIENDFHGRAKSPSMRENLARRMSALSTSSLVNLATTYVDAVSDIQRQEKKNKEKQTDKEKHEVIQEKQDIANIEKEKIGYKMILRDLLDVSLLKNCAFINLCFGVSFVCTADYAFSSLLPLMMSDLGYTKADAALALTINGIADMTSKISLAVFTLFVNVKPKYIFFTAMIITEFVRVGFLLCEHTLLGTLIMTGVISLVRAWLLVPQPLVIIEGIPIEKLASAYGIFSVISGIVTLIFGALVGLIKDWTNSFDMYQISLLVMNGAFIIPWTLQFIVDFKQWRKQRL